MATYLIFNIKYVAILSTQLCIYGDFPFSNTPLILVLIILSYFSTPPPSQPARHKKN